jgi:hypothetical protein
MHTTLLEAEWYAISARRYVLTHVTRKPKQLSDVRGFNDWISGHILET